MGFAIILQTVYNAMTTLGCDCGLLFSSTATLVDDK
jgi:hypothetical protein